MQSLDRGQILKPPIQCAVRTSSDFGIILCSVAADQAKKKHPAVGNFITVTISTLNRGVHSFLGAGQLSRGEVPNGAYLIGGEGTCDIVEFKRNRTDRVVPGKFPTVLVANTRVVKW